MAINKYYDSDCNLGVLDGKTVAVITPTSAKKRSPNVLCNVFLINKKFKN